MPTDRPRVCLLRHEDGSYRLLPTCPCLAVVLLDVPGAGGRCEHCGVDLDPESGEGMTRARARRSCAPAG